jgi:hypothetical protein
MALGYGVCFSGVQVLYHTDMGFFGHGLVVREIIISTITHALLLIWDFRDRNSLFGATWCLFSVGDALAYHRGLFQSFGHPLPKDVIWNLHCMYVLLCSAYIDRVTNFRG